MARPVRIEVARAWYHVTARGNERKAVFRDERDHVHFLELVGQLPERFGLGLHAYVLLDNHYHLLVQNGGANLSQAMQWLQVSYTVWFNRRHQRAGHLFGGRYQAIILEDGAASEVSRYVHLNPVRVQRLGLDKAAQQRQRAGVGMPSGTGLVRERLQRLREFRWSSYGAYVGRRAVPEWLTTGPVLEQLGGRGRAERQKMYQRYVEVAVREGLAESPWERLEAGVVLGGREFVESMRRRLRGAGREQPQARALQRRPGWEQIVAVVEKFKGEKWKAFRDRYGDWGRDLALHLGRRCGGLTLVALAERVGGVDYGSVAVAVRRFERQLADNRQLQELEQKARATLFND